MKFLALCPCDRVLFDKNDTPSLITLLENLQVAMKVVGEQKDTELPEKTVIPKEWHIYSRWGSSADDEGKVFEQVWQVFWPNGDVFAEHRVPLKAVKKDDFIQHSTLQMLGLPGGQEGMVRISTWLEYEARNVLGPFETTIRIKHVPFPESYAPVTAPSS